MKRQQQIMRLAEQAIELPPEQAASLLDDQCAHDIELRRAVEQLISATRDASDLLPESSNAVGESRSVQTGTRLQDRYEVCAKVGVGGMGEVYRAHDLILSRDVAIKSLSPHAIGNAEMRNRFRREVRAVAALSDPNIVAIYDVLDDGDSDFAIMEFVAGDTVEKMIDQDPDWRDSITVIQGVASGLSAAHRQNLMHRDIKPKNIIVGPDGRARLLDFGLARSTTPSADQTITGSVVPGTIPYMSPEQAAGKPLDCATDIFSLGVVTCELLTGRNPYRGNSAMETLTRIRDGRPPDLELFDSSIPKELVALTVSMLEREPARRPTARSVAEQLHQMMRATSDTDLDSTRAIRLQSERWEEERVLKRLLDGIADSVGRQFFRTLVKSLAEALGTYCAMVTEFDQVARKARAIAFWTEEGWFEGYEYTIAETPCESVYKDRELLHFPNHLQGLFPNDHDLPEMGLVSYMGVPLLDSDGTVLGNLAVLDRKPMPPQPRCVSLLRMFANRAAAEHRRLRREQEHRETPANRPIPPTTRSQLIGDSQSFRKHLRLIDQVARTDSCVVLTGETGSGKERAAREIHNRSRRACAPLICVNCATSDEDELQEELFGGESEFGLVAADRGTLLIKSITELPQELQRKLLKFLETRSFRDPATRRTCKADVRIIASSNGKLRDAVDEGLFREDLYYRLSTISVVVPPLRDRDDDVFLLADYFAREIDGCWERGFTGLTAECREWLSSHSWPGNIRELRNLVERAMITSTGGRLDIASAFQSGISPMSFAMALEENSQSDLNAERMLELERRNLRQALKTCKGRIDGDHGAAELLDIPVEDLARRIQSLGIEQSISKR